MKPYALAAALEQGISVSSRRDGSSPQTFPDRPGQPVSNASNAQCSACTLTEAITRSLNTTFYGLAYEVGPEKVRDTAIKAMDLPGQWDAPGAEIDGKPVLSRDGFTGGAIGIGEYELRPIDQAHGFATFAAGGVERDPYFVARVTDNTGAVLVEKTGDPGEQALPPDVASDVTFALEGVASYSKRALDGGRPVAAKTGTQGLNRSDNSDAWMVGYTPSLSTAVWMGSDARLPIVNSAGSIIYGSGLPGAIWEQFMDAALAGTPEEPLPSRAIIRGDTGKGVAEPTQTAAPRTTTRSAPSSSAQQAEQQRRQAQEQARREAAEQAAQEEAARQAAEEEQQRLEEEQQQQEEDQQEEEEQDGDGGGVDGGGNGQDPGGRGNGGQG
jgi:membrane peptidoglycan carboxypeptidase